MTTKEIFREAITGINFSIFPLNPGFWKNNYEIEITNYNSETGEYNISYFYTPPKAAEKIKLNFEVLQDGNIVF